MIRSRISAAALRVNVIARMFAGSTSRMIRFTYRVTRTLVFPVPAEASRMTFCSGSTANALAAASGSMARGSRLADRGLSTSNSDRCSLIAHVVLPADGGVCAPVAEKRLIGLHGKLSALDRVDGGQQPRLAFRERLLHARKL